MNTLYIVNILILVWIHLAYPVFLTRYFKFPWINPFTIMFIFELPIFFASRFIGPNFLITNGLKNPYYQYTIFTDNLYNALSLLIFIMTLYVLRSSQIFEKIKTQFTIKQIRRSRLIYASVFFLILYFVAFFLLTNKTYGFINWIIHPRIGYQIGRVGAGHYFAFAISFLSISELLFSIYARKNTTLIAGSFGYLILWYYFGSKGYILLHFTFLIISLNLREFKYLKTGLVACLTFAAAVMIYNLSTVSAENFGLEDIMRYFDAFYNSSRYFEDYFSHKISLFHGKIFLSSFWSLIPRTFYAAKPYVYGIIHVNEIYWPGAAEASGTPAFSETIKYFADFGLIGVIVMGLFNATAVVKAALYYAAFNQFSFQKLKSNNIHICFYALVVAPAFLSNFPFPINVIVTLLIAALLTIIQKIKLPYKLATRQAHDD